jgi:hypothetical protein
MATLDELHEELKLIRASIVDLTTMMRDVVLGELTLRVEVGDANPNSHWLQKEIDSSFE